MASSTMHRPLSSSTSQGTKLSWGERPIKQETYIFNKTWKKKKTDQAYKNLTRPTHSFIWDSSWWYKETEFKPLFLGWMNNLSSLRCLIIIIIVLLQWSLFVKRQWICVTDVKNVHNHAWWLLLCCRVLLMQWSQKKHTFSSISN